MSEEDREIPFLQRYNHEDLPPTMKIGELSNDFKREVWNAIWRFLKTDSGSNVLVKHGSIVRYAIGEHYKISESKLGNNQYELTSKMEAVFSRASVPKVVSFIEIFVNAPNLPNDVASKISRLFEKHKIAYWLDLSDKPYRIFERTSKEESDATAAALKKIAEHGFPAALSHLRQAAEHIHDGQYSDAIHDSISAVESVARTIEPKAKTLGEALKTLEDNGLIKHRSFKTALNQLYGFTSDEEGIRHALIERAEADVGLAEALFFYNACAAFTGYLATLANVRETPSGKE